MAVLSPLSIPAAVAGPEQPTLQARDTVISVCEMSVAVIGIGAMGGGIARALLRSDATKTVVGYDHSRDLVSAFHSESREHAKAVGKNPPDTLGGALADDPSVVFLVLVNQAQCEEVCFGADCYNLLGLMKAGSCVVLCSTVTSIWSRKAREQFISKGIRFVDCPISGGAKRALSGELTMMASGDEDALTIARPLLDAAGKEVHIISGGAGMGQTVKMVHQLLAGIHVVAAAEALALAAKTGVDAHQMYDIVCGAAGMSWMFGDRGKRMIIEGEPPVMSAVPIFVKDLGIVFEEARALRCPTPLASVALQQFISAQSLGLNEKDDSQVIQVYEKMTGVKVGGKPRATGVLDIRPEQCSSFGVTVIGIGNIGGGMARALLRSSFTSSVVAYDLDKKLVEQFHIEAKEAGKTSLVSPPTSIDEAVVEQSRVVVLTLVNEKQCEAVCFAGANGLQNLMQPGSCIVLCSTVAANWAKSAWVRFGAKGIHFVDCPVSGGAARAHAGELTMMASGDEEALSIAKLFLSAAGKEVHLIPGGAGMGQKAKMVHQLLAGVHIVAAAEALSLAAKAGLDVNQMYDIVCGAAGMSWMFGDRGERMIGEGEPPIMSMLDIFIKDLGIVYAEAMSCNSPIPLTSAALQQFAIAQGLGLGKQDDSQVVKAYEKITGVPVAKDDTYIH